MILKNKKGIKKEFNILFELEKKNVKYVVYEDPINNNIFAGKLIDNKLESLDNDEYNYVSSFLDKIEGVSL